MKKYNIVLKTEVENMYLRIMELREGESRVKLKIKDKLLNKQTVRVLPCKIEGYNVYIESLHNKKTPKKTEAKKAESKEKTKDLKLAINNKEIEELRKDYKFKILNFRKGGIAGKYIIEVEITLLETGKSFNKDYFCSISKRDKDIYFLHLAHLEPEELALAFNQMTNGCK